MSEPAFPRDLYRGTARDYDRFRLPYPQALTEDLVQRSCASGAGRLLDLACGTGQLTFALHRHFVQTWAVDQEPDMTRFVAEKARAAGIAGIRAVTSAAEDLAAPPGWFDLVVVGNAFHRLPRTRVAPSILGWLRPGGFLALAWSDAPWAGDAPWQRALSAAMQRWQARAGTVAAVPPGYAGGRAARPDQEILADAGFEPAGRRDVREDREWTPGGVVGFLFATSVLSRAALGVLAGEFDADIRRELAAAEPSGRFRQSVWSAYELYRHPG